MQPVSPATPKDKGKGKAEQPFPTMDYKHSLPYNDDEYNSGEEAERSVLVMQLVQSHNKFMQYSWEQHFCPHLEPQGALLFWGG